MSNILRDALRKQWFQSAVAIKRMPDGDHDITIEELIKTRLYGNGIDYPAGTLVIYQTDTENKMYFSRFPINANSGYTPSDDSTHWQELQIYETLDPLINDSGHSFRYIEPLNVESPKDLKYPHGDHLFSRTINAIIQGEGKNPTLVNESLEQIWLNVSVGMLLNSRGISVSVNELLGLTNYDSRCIYPEKTFVVYNKEIYCSVREVSSGVQPETFTSKDTPYSDMRLEDMRSKILEHPWRKFTPVFGYSSPPIDDKKIVEIVADQSMQEQELTPPNEVNRLTI